MGITINFHDCQNLRARFDRGENSKWVEFTIVNSRGKTQDFTVFFNDEAYARRLCEAVNEVRKTMIAEELAAPTIQEIDDEIEAADHEFRPMRPCSE